MRKYIKPRAEVFCFESNTPLLTTSFTANGNVTGPVGIREQQFCDEGDDE